MHRTSARKAASDCAHTVAANLRDRHRAVPRRGHTEAERPRHELLRRLARARTNYVGAGYRSVTAGDRGRCPPLRRRRRYMGARAARRGYPPRAIARPHRRQHDRRCHDARAASRGGGGGFRAGRQTNRSASRGHLDKSRVLCLGDAGSLLKHVRVTAKQTSATGT
jgi:hypothetical protein